MNAQIALLVLVLSLGNSNQGFASLDHKGGAGDNHGAATGAGKPSEDLQKLKATVGGLADGKDLGSVKKLDGKVRDANKLGSKAAVDKGIETLEKAYNSYGVCVEKDKDQTAVAAQDMIGKFAKWLNGFSEKAVKGEKPVMQQAILHAYIDAFDKMRNTKVAAYAYQKSRPWTQADDDAEKKIFDDVLALAKSYDSELKWMDKPSTSLDADTAKKVAEINKLPKEFEKQVEARLEYPYCKMELDKPAGGGGGAGGAGGPALANIGKPTGTATTGNPTAGPSADGKPEVPSTPVLADGKDQPADDGKIQPPGAAAVDPKVAELQKKLDKLAGDLGAAQNAANQFANSQPAPGNPFAGVDPFAGAFNPFLDPELLRQLQNQQPDGARVGGSPSKSNESSGPQISPSVSSPPGKGGGEQGIPPEMLAAMMNKGEQPVVPGAQLAQSAPMPQLPVLPTPPPVTPQADTNQFTKLMTDMNNKFNQTLSSLAMMMMGNPYGNQLAQAGQGMMNRGAAIGNAAMNLARGRNGQSTFQNGGPVNLIGRAKPPAQLQGLVRR